MNTARLAADTISAHGAAPSDQSNEPSATMPSTLYAYAWDLAGDAGRQNLEMIRGTNVDGISLATSYHAGKFLRPHATDHKVVFPEDGAVYFRPRKTYGRVQPLVAQATQQQDVLADLVADGRFVVEGWTVLLHNTRLGTLHPDLVVRNAWGDPLYYSLCPSQPEVRRYAVTLCADLCEHYRLAGLALETPGFMPFVHGYHHEFALIPGNPWMHTLLGLCFCDACTAGAKQAGLDLSPLARRIRDGVHAYMSGTAVVAEDMALHWLMADLAFDAELGAFLRWRCSVVASLVAEIRAAVDKRRTVAVVHSVQRPSAASWSEGSDLAALAKACGLLAVCSYEPSVERALADFHDCRRRAGPDVEIRAILRPGHPDTASEGQLLAAVQGLAAQGVRHFGFYNFGHLRPHNLDWMSAALRSLATPGKKA